MIDIDFTREDIETIRESLRSTRQSYLNAVDSGIYDSKVIVISLDWCKEMKVRALGQFITDLRRWKAFVCYNNPFSNVVVTNKSSVGASINDD